MMLIFENRQMLRCSGPSSLQPSVATNYLGPRTSLLQEPDSTRPDSQGWDGMGTVHGMASRRGCAAEQQRRVERSGRDGCD
ncbi:hypothetical protein LY76DRAFT_597282, partial [Colletotrichum caudatum]